jgi:hypothetical protein
LDDNTFTNKTWSDVSGMKVHDLNIMESEFLEALDYNLFVRQHEYGIWKQLLEECRDRLSLSSYNHINPQQRHQLIIMTLQTLGLISNNNTTSMSTYWERLQLENSQKRYQHFLQQQQNNQLPYVIQPPAYHNAWDYNNTVTNLSQLSWDPLAYSLNRGCQDYTSYYSTMNNPIARPISWRNYS